MISSIEVTGIGYELDDKTKDYVIKKIGRLDRYITKHARKSVEVQVKIREVNRGNGNKYEAEVIFSLPEKTITATDSTVNALAAVDIVEAKILTQLRKYKQETITHIGKRGIMGRFKRSFKREL